MSPDWHTAEYPELRSGPPWVTEEMIAAQPAVAEAMADALGPTVDSVATAVREALAAGRAVTVVGCGTSEHSAEGIAACLRAAVPIDARARVRAEPALTAALDPVPGLCVAVSHDGGTRATLHALEAARRAGARTVAITARAGSAVAEAADIVLCTPRHDRSWCHTVAYTTALLAGAHLAAALGAESARSGLGARAGTFLERALGTVRAALAAGEVGVRLADRRVLLCAGAGIDRTTARELALKVAEGARQPAVAVELETVTHGLLAGHDERDGLVLVGLAPEELVSARLAHVAASAGAIGLPVAGILSPELADALAAELTPAGRIVLEAAPGPLGPLLAGAAALQLLTVELARVHGVNPDLIRREEAVYRRAAGLAEDPGW